VTDRDRETGVGGKEAARRESGGVVQLMDDGVKSLEAAVESAQGGSDVSIGAWEKVHERVQEAESLVKKLKSLCRRHAMH